MPWDMRKTIRERMDRVGASLTAKLRDHHDPRLAFEHRVDTWFGVLGLHRVALPIADAVLFHAPADLLRRPAHLQVLDNVHTDCLVLETPSATSVLSLLERPVMCPSWRVPARVHGIVPTDLPRD